jgi:ethanolamine transporter EutH
MKINENDNILEQADRKKNALGTLISMILLILCALASRLCGTRAIVEVVYANEDTFAICAIALAIISYILILIFAYFGIKMLRLIYGKGIAYYLIISIGIIIIALALLFTIPSLISSLKLI